MTPARDVPTYPIEAFRLVIRSTGYLHDYNKHGSHGSANLDGVQCPHCGNVFMPPVDIVIVCPKCGARGEDR